MTDQASDSKHLGEVLTVVVPFDTFLNMMAICSNVEAWISAAEQGAPLDAKDISDFVKFERMTWPIMRDNPKLLMIAVANEEAGLPYGVAAGQVVAMGDFVEEK